MLLHCQVVHGLLQILIRSMLCVTIQTRLFELDLTLSKPAFAPALLQAFCVAFGNVFIRPAPQFSPSKKMGIMFFSPKGLGG